MTVEFVTTLFALLLLATAALVIISLIVPSLRPALSQIGIYGAAAVAIGAMVGSLYLSESAGFEPCRLCWFQRIAMYPLALILPISIATHDNKVRKYAYPLAIIGAIIAIYHVQLQIFPSNDAFCPPEGGCAAIWVEALGFMTIPQMALISFLLILAFLWASRPRTAEVSEAATESETEAETEAVK